MGIVSSALDLGASRMLAATADTAANAYRKRWGVGVFDPERNLEMAETILADASMQFENAECVIEVIRTREALTLHEELEFDLILRKLRGFYGSLKERCHTAARVGGNVTIDAQDMKEIGGCYELFYSYYDQLEELVINIHQGEQ